MRIYPDKDENERIIDERVSLINININSETAEISRKPFIEFVLSNIKLRGKRFSFRGHSYLHELYEMPATRAVYMKAAQVGLSTFQLTHSIWLSYRGYKTVYFFPTSSMARSFARDRFKPLLKHLAKNGISGPADSVRIGSGAVLFKGLLSEEGVRSIDADNIVLDEFDVISPARAELAADRLLHSDLGGIAYLSTPTLPGKGVDALYHESDQRRWLVSCTQCPWEGDLTDYFPDCLIEIKNEVLRVCPKCNNRVDVERGRWVAAYPSQTDLRGYHISHLITNIPAKKILNDYKKANRSYQKRRFYNSILGLPYSDGTAGLTAEVLQKAIKDAPKTRTTIYMGVDVGDILYASVIAVDEEDKLYAISNQTLSGFDELERLFDAHQPNICVIDAMPYKSSAVKFAKRFAGRVYIAYLGAGRYMPGVERHSSGDVLKLGLDRTSAIDELVEDIRDGRLSIIPGNDLETVERHLLSLERIVVEDDKGKSRAVWQSSGEDHFAFALLFAREAVNLFSGTGQPTFGEKRHYGK